MTQATYIVGAPGSGKSTLMARLLDGWEAGPYTKWTTREMFGHILTRTPNHGGFCVLCLSGEHKPELGAYLGHLRGEFPGTDALSLSVAPQALLWAQALPVLGLTHVYGEGIRLSHLSFLVELHQHTELTVIYLNPPEEVCAQRRLARGGKQLSEAFCKNVSTRAARVAEACRKAGIKVVEQED